MFQIPEINALAAPTNPAPATTLASTIQKTSNALSFIFLPCPNAPLDLKHLMSFKKRAVVDVAECCYKRGVFSLSSEFWSFGSDTVGGVRSLISRWRARHGRAPELTDSDAVL